jgi:hypothetical protein
MVALAMLFFASNTMASDPPGPVLSALDPMQGPPDSRVKLSGSNLTAVTLVRFGDSATTPESRSNTDLVVAVPPDAQTGPVTAYGNGRFGSSRTAFVVLRTPIASPTPTPTATPRPTATASPELSPSPSPTPTPSDFTLEPTCWSYRLTVDSRAVGSPAYDQALRGRLAELFAELAVRRVGFVLTFAQSIPDGDGSRVAGRINELLAEAAPSTFADARMKSYLALGRSPGAVEIQVYLFPGNDVEPSVEQCRD